MGLPETLIQVIFELLGVGGIPRENSGKFYNKILKMICSFHHINLKLNCFVLVAFQEKIVESFYNKVLKMICSFNHINLKLLLFPTMVDSIWRTFLLIIWSTNFLLSIFSSLSRFPMTPHNLERITILQLFLTKTGDQVIQKFKLTRKICHHSNFFYDQGLQLAHC